MPGFFVLLKSLSSSRAVKILFSSFTCEDIGVAMVTNMISQLQESFPLRRAAGSFEISFTKWLRGAKTVRLPVTFSMSCQIFTSILFPSLKNIQEDLPKTDLLFQKWKKSCILCKNFVLKVSLTILSAHDDNIRIPARPCNIFYIYIFFHQWLQSFFYLVWSICQLYRYSSCLLFMYVFIYQFTYLLFAYKLSTYRFTYYQNVL